KAPFSGPDEGEELLEIPSVGLDPSFRSATLLPLVRTELLDQIRQGMRHGLGPPVRATTTFSPIGSMGRYDPPVKGGDAAIGTGSDDRGHRAGESPLSLLGSVMCPTPAEPRTPAPGAQDRGARARRWGSARGRSDRRG